MITVDCREVENFKHEMAVFVSDWVGAIPTIKLHEFMLSPLENEGLEMDRVVKAVKEFFASIGETANYGVLTRESLVLIKSLHDKPVQKAKQQDFMFTCSHCGYITPYEGLWQTHMKIHYL